MTSSGAVFIRIVVIVSGLLAAAPGLRAETRESLRPFAYPAGVIGNPRPMVIWKDLYTERDSRTAVQYRITIRNIVTNRSLQYLATPLRYYNTFYGAPLPDRLDAAAYRCTIERLIDGKPVKSRHYHYRTYPISQDFIVDPAADKSIDSLPPEYLIAYRSLERTNSLKNGNNVLFFGSASTMTLGIGILFYRYWEFGIISKIIYTLCFASSACGYTATGVYAYKYLETRQKLVTIYQLGRTTKFKSGIIDKAVNAAVELSF